MLLGSRILVDNGSVIKVDIKDRKEVFQVDVDYKSISIDPTLTTNLIS